MRTRVAAIAMAVLLAVYLVFALNYGVILIGTGVPIAIALGLALLVFPIIGVGALIVELVFGVRAERLGRRLDAEGGLPGEQLPLRASGRIDRAAADAAFPHFQAEAEADPENWRVWYRLALAYDAAGDRRRARWATRQAIALSRATSVVE